MRAADGSTRLAIGAAYRFIRNQSNDAYHDYSNHQGALTLDLAF
jgi:hypothetical protein